MAYSKPDDPYRAPLPGDEYLKPAATFDNELQPDPELAEGPASGSRVAVFALAIALVLGAVFYGLNNTSVNQPGTSTAQNTPAAQDSAQNKPPVAPGVRDVTPRTNTEPGTTTGAAPARPQQPPKAAPMGTEIDRSATPPNSAAGAK